MSSMFCEKYAVRLTESHADADFIICQSSIDHLDCLHKTVYISAEPPRTNHRRWCYTNLDKLLLAVVFNPDPSKSNQIPFQPDDNAQWYLARADPYPYITRENTTMSANRGVFFAGGLSSFDYLKDQVLPDNAKSISHLRRIMGEFFVKNHKGSIAIGVGWNGQKKKSNNWRREKWDISQDPDIDFVLSLENTIQSNYLSEKIWDGIASDKVTLYLGDSRIEYHVPTNCFVDLRPYYDFKKDVINIQDISDRLKSMTQEEYDSIIINARIFREKSKGKYKEYSIALTKKIINFLTERKKNDTF